MFSKYELKLMQEILTKDYAKEYVRRETDGLSQDTIRAQLGGMFDLLVKINIQLADQA